MYDGEGSHFFRVYHSNGTFTDYDISHSDLSVTIEDDDAMFKGEDTDSPYLDYSEQTLGRK